MENPMNETATVAAEAMIVNMMVDAMEQIKNGAMTPKDSEIGRVLAQLRTADPAKYKELLLQYNTIAFCIFDDGGCRLKLKQSVVELDKKKKKPVMIRVDDDEDEADVEQEILDVEEELPVDREDIFGDGEPKRRGRKSIPGKLQKEKRVRVAAERSDEPAQAKYEYDGGEYRKGPLVLAIIRKHVERNPDVCYDALKSIFHDGLMRGYGVFAKLDFANEKSKGGRKRYFMNDDQHVKLADCTVVVCNQITGDNVVGIIEVAKKNGHEIK